MHTRKKDNPAKEAYKLAHGHAREQIGVVEVNDKASSSHENQRVGRKELFYATTSYDISHTKRSKTDLSKDITLTVSLLKKTRSNTHLKVSEVESNEYVLKE